MKKLLIIIMCLHFNIVGFSQILNDVDEIYPFQEGIAPVKIGNQWGFINKNGELVIDYRGDFVMTKNMTANLNKPVYYPVFKSERCLIAKLKGAKYYYGYIDKSGNEIVKPQYLNASNFVNGYAIVITESKTVVGFNKVLGKNVISKKIEEFIIDTSGEIVKYLENPRPDDVLDRKPKTPPAFHSKFIAPHMVAVQKRDEKWDIYKF